MPPGIDVLTATPMTVEIGGRMLRIAPLTLANLGELQAWVNAQLVARLPDPVAIARRLAEGFPVEVQSEILREAYRDARDARESKPTAPIGSAEAKAIVGTTEGIREVLTLSLKKHHPELTADDVTDLMGSLLPRDIDHIVSHAFGTVGSTSDPKAPGADPDGVNPSTGLASTNGSGGSPTDSIPMRSVG